MNEKESEGIREAIYDTEGMLHVFFLSSTKLARKKESKN